MKKINVKATIFLSAIVLVVVVLLLNLIEFRKNGGFHGAGDTDAEGERFRKAGRGTSERQRNLLLPGTALDPRQHFPWADIFRWRGRGTAELFLYLWSKQRISEGGKRGWLDRNPGCSDYRSDLSGGTECGKRDDIRRESRQLRFISGGNTGRSLCHSGYMVSGMLENEAKTAFCAAFLPEECPQKIGCSFCAEDYDYVEDVDTVEQLWQEFIQLSGKVTSDPIPPEEMVEGVGYFQFVYADGETRTFRYASEEQGLWIGEDERCLVDGQAFYDWQERLMEALQK